MNKIFSIASLLAAAVMLTSCGGEKDDPIKTDSITISVDKDVIKCDGSDAATITVKSAEGDVIKEGVTFFDANNNEVTFTDFKFTTDKAGEYTFWASYMTAISSEITIKAIDADIPASVTDPKPTSKSFVRRVLLTQFTGTDCGFCPGMVNWIRALRSDADTHNKTVLMAVHSYQSGDPAYISSPAPGAFGGNGFPYLNLDAMKNLGISYSNSGTDEYFAGLLRQAVNDRIEDDPATAAISANPVIAKNLTVSGSTSDYLIVKTAIKVSETGEYTIGAALLEDGIYGKQLAYTQSVTLHKDYDYDTHNNCVRALDIREGSDWTGRTVGKVLEGDTAVKTFLFKLKSGWKVENMHLVIFTCKKGEDGVYRANNSIDCPISSPTPFEYK